MLTKYLLMLSLVNHRMRYMLVEQIYCFQCYSHMIFLQGCPSKVHDSRVLKLSPASTQIPELCEGDRWHILGDKAYPLLPYLITPYRNDENLSLFRQSNYCHSATRVVIENAFGILKQRFRQLSSMVDFNSVDKVTKFMMCFCVLHNLCIMEGDVEEFAEEEDPGSDDIQHGTASNTESSIPTIELRQQAIKKEILWLHVCPRGNKLQTNVFLKLQQKAFRCIASEIAKTFILDVLIVLRYPFFVDRS